MSDVIDGPGQFNWDIFQSAPLSRPFTISENGTPIDFTDAVFRAEVKKDKNETLDATIVLTVDVTNDVGGEITISATATDTDVPSGIYVWSLVQTEPAIKPWLWGRFIVSGNIINV